MGGLIRVALLDLDICVYHCASACSPDESLAEVKNTVDMFIRDWMLKAGATHYVGFVTGDNNFRKQIAQTWVYKGHRLHIEKPSWYPQVKQYVIDHWKALVMEDMEADDGLAIAQTLFQRRGIESIIVTEDKDLLQVPGLHLNKNKSDTVFTVTEEQAHKNLWLQVVTGDATDNIPGVSHAIHETTIGTYNKMIKDTVEDSAERIRLYKQYPKQELYGASTAFNYLSEFDPSEWPSKVWELYVDKYEEDDYGDFRFQETFALIFMLREHPDYQDFEIHEIPVDQSMFDDYD